MVLAAVASAPAGAGVLKRLDYETGNFSQWTSVQALSGGAKIVRSPRKQGRFAARYVVRPGDDPINSSGERAEAFFRTGERAGVTSWWKWSTRFPRNFRPIVGSMNVFTDWHHNGPTCPAPVSFDVDRWKTPARLQLRVLGGSLDPVTCEVGGGKVWDLGRLRRGRWLTFVFHVRWSPDRSQGFVEVWRNGRKVVPLRHIATLYKGYSVYLKQGYYRKPAGWRAVVYHDGLRRFSSRPRLR